MSDNSPLGAMAAQFLSSASRRFGGGGAEADEGKKDASAVSRELEPDLGESDRFGIVLLEVGGSVCGRAYGRKMDQICLVENCQTNHRESQQIAVDSDVLVVKRSDELAFRHPILRLDGTPSETADVLLGDFMTLEEWTNTFNNWRPAAKPAAVADLPTNLSSPFRRVTVKDEIAGESLTTIEERVNALEANLTKLDRGVEQVSDELYKSAVAQSHQTTPDGHGHPPQNKRRLWWTRSSHPSSGATW